MNAGRTFHTPSGVVLSEQALDVGLAPLRRAHELQLQRAEQERLERRRNANRDRRLASALQRSLV